MTRSMVRSILAVIAGIVTLTATSFAIEAAADPILMRLFPHALPNRAAISQNLASAIFLLVYTGACVAAGGYVTAWIARRSPIWHALAMGVVQEGLTVWAMASLPNAAPLRNWIETLVLTIPLAWCGGLLRAKHAKRNGAPAERVERATA